MDRISSICALLDGCDTFADIGCDHGYCTEYMLAHGLCRKAYIADISAKSLSKAEKLLAKYIKNGSCESVCCDGLSGFETLPRQVLIAGMGGEEIIKILSDRIPEKFLLQPMKNAPRLRKFLLESGCAITYDGVFKDGKYYFIIKGGREGAPSAYSELEYAFGRDSLKSPVLTEYLKEEIQKCRGYLALADTAEAERQINEKINFYGSALKCTPKTC